MNRIRDFLWRIGAISTSSILESRQRKAMRHAAKDNDILVYDHDDKGKINGYHPAKSLWCGTGEHRAGDCA